MNSKDIEYMTSLGLEARGPSDNDQFYYHRGLKNPTNPVLVLLHGYPQTNFMWRQVVSLLPPDVPLFIPDLPGYGRSKPLSEAHSKLNQGKAILSTLSNTLLPHTRQPIILVGHDRGARICHRLAVDNDLESNLPILGVVLLDIVPTIVQWRSFADATASMGTFHWPFLANVELATKMIQAQGGDVWARFCLDRWAGKSEVGLAKFKEHGAFDVYGNSFKNESVLRASCDDYRAGAEEDVSLQEEDQKRGRKINVKTLVMFSSDYLGSRYDVRKVWGEWMKEGSENKLEVVPIGGGAGHFIAEEASDQVATAILEFYKKPA